MDKNSELMTTEKVTKKVMFVRIQRSYGELLNRQKLGKEPVKGRENIYQCTRKYWKVNKENAEQADYIAGVFRNDEGIYIIKSVYKNSEWKKVKDFPEMSDDEEVIENPKYLDRFAFSGIEENVVEPSVWKEYVGTALDFDFSNIRSFYYNYKTKGNKKR